MNDPHTTDPRAFLNDLMDAAIAAADPIQCVPPHLPDPPEGRTVVLGGGKASAAMARAVEDNWQGEISGLIVTRYGYAVGCDHIEIVEAAHPVPDRAGLEATERMVEMAHDLGPDDLCLALMSGGASSLLTMPAPGLTLEDKQAVNRALLQSGATISEMNCVRKHLSAIKGGRLARAIAPASLVTLMISDVPVDDPAVIGSGPTVPDTTTFAEARAVIEKYGIDPGDAARRFLDEAAEETPKPGDPVFAGAIETLVARPKASLEAAAEAARSAGVTPVILGDALEGESRAVAEEHAALARRIQDGDGPAQAPAVLLSGGETTVTIRGTGDGGPNTEYALALSIALDGRDGIWGLAVDTDGTDGSRDNAGGLVSPGTIERARTLGMDATALLANNDSYGYFEDAGGLVVTGPTFTNVNDFRAVLVLSSDR